MKKRFNFHSHHYHSYLQNARFGSQRGNTSLRMLALLFLFSMLSFRPNIVFTQSLNCPSPLITSGSGAVPFDPNWSSHLLPNPRIIPTVVHLIGNLPAGLTQAQVDIAIQQLNADFSAPNPLWGIQFRLARFAPDGSCTNGVTYHPELSQFSNYKSLTGWPNQSYLNIWVVVAINNDPGILGAVSVLPTLFSENATCNGLDRIDRIAGQSPAFDSEDGVEIKLDEFYPNNAGRHSLTHETGHWLNLMHVFQDGPPNGCGYWDNCHPLSQLATNGDLIDDTNPQKEVNTFNPATCNTNAGECFPNVPANLNNFMSYAHPCANSFTQGQRQWMFACMLLNRPFIWSAENLRCTGVVPALNNISGNVIWDLSTVPGGFVQVPQEIHILANSSLTVGAGITVQFCDNAKLVVDPGAHLILNGTLTNTCYGKMWAGVEVRGTGTSINSTQWPNNSGVYAQGRLTANPGSIIQNALTGIFVGGAGGGIVKCTGTTFLNNRKAVQFDAFENHLPIPNAPVTSNSSHFTNCDFTTDAGYLGDNPAIYEPSQQKRFDLFAELKDVRGIRFLGCDFVNLRTDLILQSDFGRGILSTESGFVVANFCNANGPFPCPAANQVKCTFKNLYEGIFVGETDVNGELPKFYEVQSALFQGCWTGIRSEEGSRGIIVQNTFEIGNVPVAAADLAIIGVLLESGHTTFSLQENTFRLGQPILPDLLQSGVQFIGSRSYWIGINDNLIRKNYYQNLTIGNESVGDNATVSGITGLRYLCNENVNNSPYDFNVRYGQGVRNIQGEVIPGPIVTNLPAGNVFSHINLPESDFRNSALNAIQYFHRPVVPETPQTFTNGAVTPVIVGADKQCESIYCDPPCRSEQQINLAKQAISTAKSDYNTVYTSYAQQPNGPNAVAQKNTLSGLQAVMQDNTFDVLLNIVATEGSLTDYRYWLGNLDAYETDLALAKSYVGTGEYAQANTLLNAIPSKHALSGDKLNEFNDYRAVLNILQVHLQNGGNKFNLPAGSVNALKSYAENNNFARVRGQAKAMLAMYGILYPPEAAIETGHRSTDMPLRTTTEEFTLIPNPADQSVRLGLKTGTITTDLTGQVSLYSVQGRLLFQQNIVAGADGVNIPLAGWPNGCYLVQVRLSNGNFATLPLVIAH